MSEPAILGADLFGEPIRRRSSGPLAERFVVPPFSVLDARSGEWQERKRQWLALGIQSEVGRSRFNYASRQAACLAGGYLTADGAQKATSDSSVFDPLLCEVAYRWFSATGDQILDPFAGGSVRGVVASLLSRAYHGVDLRAEQIAANEGQRHLCGELGPVWVCGDSLEEVPRAPRADFVFSCPPYGDLERYSDDPRDLSTMEYHSFRANLSRVVQRCCERLKDDRFAAFVVGDFRDGGGFYRGFVGHVIQAFEEQRVRLYNEAVLVTPAGSLPIRTATQFPKVRKLGRSHQTLLVFCKGNPRVAAARIMESP